MNSGINGAASTSTSAAAHDTYSTTTAMQGNTSITRQRAGW